MYIADSSSISIPSLHSICSSTILTGFDLDQVDEGEGALASPNHSSANMGSLCSSSSRSISQQRTSGVDGSRLASGSSSYRAAASPRTERSPSRPDSAAQGITVGHDTAVDPAQLNVLGGLQEGSVLYDGSGLEEEEAARMGTTPRSFSKARSRLASARGPAGSLAGAGGPSMDGAISEVLDEALKALQQQQAAEGCALAQRAVAVLSSMAGRMPEEACPGAEGAASGDTKLQELLERLKDAPMATRYVHF